MVRTKKPAAAGTEKGRQASNGAAAPSAAAERAAQMAVLDRAERTLKAQEIAGLRGDYDAALKEYAGHGGTFEVVCFGRTWQLPAEPPARIVTYYLAECVTEEGGKLRFVLPDSKIRDFISVMLGQEFAAAFMASAAPVTFLVDVILPDIFRRWGLEFTADSTYRGPEGNAATHAP